MAQTCFKLQVLRVRAPILTEIAPSSIFSYHMRVESTKSNLLVAKLKTKCLLPVGAEEFCIGEILHVQTLYVDLHRIKNVTNLNYPPQSYDKKNKIFVAEICQYLADY